MVTRVSVVVPTYNEAENVAALVPEITQVFKRHNIEGTILVVDDDSPDETWRVADELGRSFPVRSVRRRGKRGLSSAVIDGLRQTTDEIVGFMDADFSHPPEQIADLVRPVRDGKADLVVGSRYMREGAITQWSWYRRFSSKVATLLALPFTRVKDPMSGFVFFRREVVKDIALNPIGFKLGLEIIAKGRYKKFLEVPITFGDRRHGESKLSSGVVLDYLKQLWQLYWEVETVFGQFVKFCLVGSSGVLVNMAVYALCLFRFGVHYLASAVVAFVVALTTNFFLNRRWTFRVKRGTTQTIGKQYSKFALVCLMGLGVNLISLSFLHTQLGLHEIPAQLISILIATSVHFVGSRSWAFKR